MLNQLVHYLEVAGAAVAIGALFDQVFLTEQSRERLRALITKKGPNARGTKLGATEVLLSQLRFLRDNIFSKYLGGSLLSWKYFVRSSVVSVCFAVFISVYQNSSSSEVINYIAKDNFNFLVFFIFILLNMIVDYVSTIQTNIFLDFSISSGKPIYIFSAFISDILVTVAIFKFIYSALVFLIIAFCLLTIQNKEFDQTNIKLHYDVAKRKISDGSWEYTVVGKRQISGQASFTFLDADVLDALPYFDPTPFSFYASNGKKTVSQIQPVSQNPQDSVASISSVNNVAYTVDVVVKPPHTSISYQLYFPIFRALETVENDFLVFIRPNLSTVTVSDAVGVSFGFSPFDNSKFCYLQSKIYVDQQRLSEEDAKKYCSSKFVAVRGLVYSDDDVLWNWNTSVLSKEIPLSNFFVASFSITVLLYIMLINLIFMRICFGFLSRYLRGLGEIWMRAPFGLSFFVIGSLLVLLT